MFDCIVKINYSSLKTQKRTPTFKSWSLHKKIKNSDINGQIPVKKKHKKQDNNLNRRQSLTNFSHRLFREVPKFK